MCDEVILPRLESNRAAEMEVFVRVVDLGGFTAAAREFRITPSSVSKLMSRLEARLSARLVHRSTRQLQLTPEGRGFYERAVRVLAEIDEAEREASAGARPRGHLRVNSNVPFAMRYVAALLPGFLAAHPEITLDLELSDTVVDLLHERADIALRVGPLRDSSLIARKLATSRMAVVAAPAYLARRGTPMSPAQLADHAGIGWTFHRTIGGWPFATTRAAAHRTRRGRAATIDPVPDAQVVRALPPPLVRVSDGESARLLALGGVGLARLALFHIRDDLASGRLVPVLEALNPGDREDIHAVYLGRGGPLPARVRALLDYLAHHIAIPDERLIHHKTGWQLQSRRPTVDDS